MAAAFAARAAAPRGGARRLPRRGQGRAAAPLRCGLGGSGHARVGAGLHHVLRAETHVRAGRGQGTAPTRRPSCPLRDGRRRGHRGLPAYVDRRPGRGVHLAVVVPHVSRDPGAMQPGPPRRVRWLEGLFRLLQRNRLGRHLLRPCHDDHLAGQLAGHAGAVAWAGRGQRHLGAELRRHGPGHRCPRPRQRGPLCDPQSLVLDGLYNGHSLRDDHPKVL
mmetsp:Transcript_71948/g.220253  ORF Transcript_71948/g.220253 Transcript_71948/m.220253 type:complete len:219 (-) Transcript_71948:1007-1663(-)